MEQLKYDFELCEPQVECNFYNLLFLVFIW